MHTEPTGEPKSIEPKSTRERVLDAAEELFAERGFAGTAVRDIAALVGVNAASLYNHFASKEQLYEAVLDRGLQPVFDLLAELTPGQGAPAAEPNEEAIDRIVVHFAERPHLAKLIHHDALTGGVRLAAIAGRSLGPIYRKALEALSQGAPAEGTVDGGVQWAPEELPFLLAAFENMIIGYFALGPLMETLLGADPLSDQALARQTLFLRKAARLLVPVRRSPAPPV